MKKKPIILIAFFILLAFFLFSTLNVPVLQWLELKSIDWRFAIRGPVVRSEQVVVVAIDEKSLHREGRWPWPRQKVTQLINAINAAGAELIASDIIFAEANLEEESLARALAQKNNVILGYFFYATEHELAEAELSVAEQQRHFSVIQPAALPQLSGLRDHLFPMAGVVANTTRLAQAARSQGYFNAMPDPDGVIRRFPLMVTYRDQIFPALATETLSQYEGFDPVPIRDVDDVLKGLAVGSRHIPTNTRGEMLINYRGGRDTFTTYAATDFLQGKVAPGTLEGKTVLLGATAVGIYDLRVTPISPNLPGVLVQANLLDNLYQGDFLTQSLWAKLGALLYMLVVTLLLTWLLPRMEILSGFLTTLLVMSAYVVASQWLFEHGTVLLLAMPSLEVFTLLIAITLYRGFTEQHEKRMIRTAFQSYLHPELVRELTQDLKKLELGGQRTTCTILFADVRDFTAISEKIPPEQLVDLMNQYFDPISQAIIDEGGYIDKFIGDAVMAVFGAPRPTEEHAAQACRAAQHMQRSLQELAPEFQRRFGIETFRIGIGIHTGPVVVGNVGTKGRLNYTAMGDTVNVASRLEGLTKQFDIGICISEATCDRLPSKEGTRYLERIQVKGKEEAVPVYELQP